MHLGRTLADRAPDAPCIAERDRDQEQHVDRIDVPHPHPVTDQAASVSRFAFSRRIWNLSQVGQDRGGQRAGDDQPA